MCFMYHTYLNAKCHFRQDYLKTITYVINFVIRNYRYCIFSVWINKLIPRLCPLYSPGIFSHQSYSVTYTVFSTKLLFQFIGMDCSHSLFSILIGQDIFYQLILTSLSAFVLLLADSCTEPDYMTFLHYPIQRLNSKQVPENL